MNGTVYTLAVIAVCTLGTWFTRALPFLIFGKRPLPAFVKYLGNVLPAMIMAVLVVYCLRNTDFAGAAHGLPEILACVCVAGIHLWKKNMYLSIVAGTVAYMILIRVF